MTFTDEQPFLDAIFARYHDDGPRLIYADYLDAAGEPERAELVRVQLALARMTPEHPRRPELAERQAELLNANRARWTAHLQGLVTDVDFRRGVPDSVVVDAAVFLETGEELFRRLRVRRLSLRNDTGVMPKLVESPLLARVRELDLWGNDLGNGGVALLVRSPHLQQLDALDLGANGLDDAGVETLARSSNFPALTVLSLNNNDRITAEGVAQLAASPFFAGLTTLDVSGNDITDAGVRAVVDSAAMARLHTFNVSGNPIGDAGASALAKSELLGRVLARTPRLELRKCEIGPEGVAALVASPALKRCGTLDLTGNDAGDRGFAAVVTTPNLTHLRVLKLGRNQITDAGVAAVRTALPRLLAQLHLLDISENRLTRSGMGRLVAARGNLPVKLELAGNVQTSAAGEAPVPVGDVVPDLLREVAGAAAAADLKRRVAHPTMRPPERPNPNG